MIEATEAGEDWVALCPACGYAANLEKAESVASRKAEYRVQSQMDDETSEMVDKANDGYRGKYVDSAIRAIALRSRARAVSRLSRSGME